MIISNIGSWSYLTTNQISNIYYEKVFSTLLNEKNNIDGYVYKKIDGERGSNSYYLDNIHRELSEEERDGLDLIHFIFNQKINYLCTIHTNAAFNPGSHYEVLAYDLNIYSVSLLKKAVNLLITQRIEADMAYISLAARFLNKEREI